MTKSPTRCNRAVGLSLRQQSIPLNREEGGSYDAQGTGKLTGPVIVLVSHSETGVAPGGVPKPQYAFKVSMINVSCNSH